MDQINRISASEDDTLGGRIIHARDLSGMSVEDVASRIGVTAETLAEWESDRSAPRANKLMTLAGVLAVSPAWLISGTGEGPEHPDFRSAVQALSGEIGRLRDFSQQVGGSIDSLQNQLDSLVKAARA